MFGDWDAGASHACYLDLSFPPRYWYRPALLLRTGSWQVPDGTEVSISASTLQLPGQRSVIY